MMLSSKTKESVRVIDSRIPIEKYIPIDLSVNNCELEKIALDDAAEFQQFIDQHLKDNNAIAAYGGYNEERNLYKTSAIFSDEEAERNIHIGLDIWATAGTTVLAAENGKIHSFNYNPGKGNYGPTIILEHGSDGMQFYTLYGHLSLDSIESIEIGDSFRKGQKIATLGGATINGGYPPHLHFQIIKSIDGYFGDYPGVCSINERVYYLENCPDPNILLQIY